MSLRLAVSPSICLMTFSNLLSMVSLTSYFNLSSSLLSKFSFYSCFLWLFFSVLTISSRSRASSSSFFLWYLSRFAWKSSFWFCILSISSFVSANALSSLTRHFAWSSKRMPFYLFYSITSSSKLSNFFSFLRKCSSTFSFLVLYLSSNSSLHSCISAKSFSIASICSSLLFVLFCKNERFKQRLLKS